VFADVVARYPDAAAVVDGARTYTYTELDGMSDRIAGWLVAAGIGPEDLVAVLVDRTVALPAGVLGVWKAGGAYLALDPQTPRARLRSIAAQLRPAAVLTTSDLMQRALPMAPQLLCADRPIAPHPGRRVAVAEDNLAYVIHTSGSTGSPKGVGVSHRALLSVIRSGQAMYGWGTAIRRVVGLSSFGFDVGTGDLARALFTGSCLVLCPSHTVVSPPDLVALIRAHRVEYAEITPSLLRPLIHYLRGAGQRLDPLRVLVVGGELYPGADLTVTREVLGDGVRIVNTYGLTEAAIDSLWHEPGTDDRYDGGVPIGRPIVSTRAEVLDRELHEATDGELYVSGDQLARGYLGDAATTAARFVPSGTGPAGSRRYRTGDLVSRRPDGELIFRRRVDDLVKVNGVRLSLLEVQLALATHPLLHAVAVDLVSTPGREAIVAWVVPATDGSAIDTSDIRRYAASVLPRAAVPAHVLVVPALPVTANGKLDLAALRAAHRPERDSATVTPATDAADTVAVLAVLAARRLGVHPGPDDDFFELGGDSLRAAAWAGDIRSEFGIDLPTASVLEHPTAAGLAVIVDRAARAEVIAHQAGRTRGPLAPAQRRLWMLQDSGDDLAAYNVPFAVDIVGDLRLDALSTAWRGLLAQHASLRTSVHSGPDGPWQRVNDVDPAELAIVEVADEDEARRWVSAQVQRPIRLDRPSLVWAVLLRLPDRHRLVACAHHLVCDGESVRTLLADLGMLYRAALDARSATLPPQRMSYLDYSAWQDTQLRHGRYDRQLRAVCQRLSGAASAARLPQRPAGADGGDGRHRTTIDATCTAALRALAREHRTTLFVVLLAAFGGVVRRWTAQDEVLVGVPYGDRTIAGTERLVGFFVDTTAVRLATAAEASFADLLRTARAATAFAAGHRGVPYDLVHHSLRRAGTQLDLTFWFNFLGPPESPPDFGPATTTTVLDLPPAGPLFAVNLYISDHGDTMDVTVVLDCGRIDPSLAAELARQYERMLCAVAAAPERQVRDHPLTAAATPATGSLQRLVPAATGTPPSVPDLLSKHPRDATAIRSPDGEHSFAQVSIAVAVLASRLRTAGVSAGEIVAIFLPRGPELVTAMLAAWSAGADFCVLDPHAPSTWIGRLLDAAPAIAVLVATDPPDELIARVAQVVDPSSRPVPAIAAGGPQPGARQRPARIPGHLAFTSGTSGTPKPVRADGRPLQHFLRRYVDAFHLSAADRYAMLAGLGHDPLLREVFTALLTGASLSIPPEQLIRSPRELGQWIATERVTVLHLTPPMLRLLTGRAQPALPAVRLVVCGGDQLYYADVQAIRAIAPNATVVNAYGATETPQIQAWSATAPGDPVGAPDSRVPVDSGIDGLRVRVVDRLGRATAVGEVGQLRVETVFLADGLGSGYDTGDLGRLRWDGLIEVLGRADEQVKISGHRVEPQELDAAVRGLPQIADARTLAVSDARGRVRLVVYAVAISDPPRLAAVRAALRGEVPAHLLPAELVVVDALPLTGNGKLDRSALAALPATAATSSTRAPRSTMERHIAAEWSATLECPAPDIDTNFFDLGGTSLLMAELQNRLERRLGLRIPMLTLLEYPAVRLLAAHLTSAGAPAINRAAGRRPASPDASRRIAVRAQLRSEDLW
jgi:amino acid adenylation domain-containing protein